MLMRAAMAGERAALGEALTALVTAEGLLARVRPAMDGEIAVGGIALPALVALLSGRVSRPCASGDGR